MNTLFNISKIEDTLYKATINPDSHIFQGHFPGNPVVPGVMSVWLVRNCAGMMLNREFSNFHTIKEVKYVSPIKPESSPVTVNLTLAADGEEPTVAAEISDKDGNLLVKLKGTLVA
ncbi:MAG: hypothetical protein MJZ27_02390 [Bacteroidales bacterium]|nr:hypothetical protein [Bacteroidales bacterium]